MLFDAGTLLKRAGGACSQRQSKINEPQIRPALVKTST
jgi:hypothetical protein